MAQFDVYRLADGVLVVDLQSDLIGIGASRVVAPLREAGRHVALGELTPQVTLAGEAWIVRVQELAALPCGEMRERAGSLRESAEALRRALSVLVDGV